MIANSKKKKSSNIFLSFLLQCGVVCMILVIVFLVITDVKIDQKKQEVNAQITAIKTKINDLNEKTATLQQESSSDNKAYIEQVAREELDLQKPGEKVVSFIAPETQQIQQNKGQKSFIQSWFAWLSGFFGSH